jgi:hypothetical protein
LFLDHGVDETTCERFCIESHGVTFESPWEFTLLAELCISVDFRDIRRGRRRRTPINGIVVGTRKLSRGVFETVVFFDHTARAHSREIRSLAEMVR